jgi:cytochrome c-type biogenesis protein CcsB
MNKLYKVLSSTNLTIILFVLLALGAAIGTFIENDYGTSTARVLIYNHIWYESVLVLSIVNLSLMIIKRKMYKNKAKFIFHVSFIFMLIGAGLTRYVGFEGIMHIKENAIENRMISLEPYLQVTINHDSKRYYKEYQFDMSALGNDFNYNIRFGKDKILNIKLNDYVYAKKQQSEMGIVKVDVSLDNQTTLLKLVGKRSMKGFGQAYEFDDTSVYIEYGSKTLHLPFKIKLLDFELLRYPGSNSPSSYSSKVRLLDDKNNVKFDYKIYMNNTLKYGNYQFFQSSYDMDEKGTILSVNNDPGKWPTYLGYFLLILGLIMNMFDKKSRFIKLTKDIQKYNSIIVVMLLSMFLNTNIYAKTDEVAYLKNFKKDSLQTAQNFAKLITQSNMGRMKPIGSLNLEIINKLTKKSSFLGMNANQLILGMLSRPELWRNVRMLKIKTPKLKQYLGVNIKRKYIAFSEVFAGDKYRLQSLVEKANATPLNKRGTYEKDILKLDEILNIQYSVFYGNIFKIFPKKDDERNLGDNNKWYNPLDAMQEFREDEKKYITYMISGMINTIINKNYTEADKFIKLISDYQKDIGRDIMPSDEVIKYEILFNKLSIFPKITLAYVLIGLVMFIISFVTVFNKKWSSSKINNALFVILFILFFIQTSAMGMRWYISGHAPWSDTYESLIYIAWSSMAAGLFFFRKSLMALSATVVMAGVFMFTAHLSGIDPQITNLVPVLKSYWLTIHVSIITGSYGFFAISTMLGFMTLLLFISRNKNNQQIDRTIKQIVSINEASVILGLAMLTIGNFIGGVWANESWGRYWGWDPKETWAWVSIIVYAIVLHLRLIPKLNTKFIFTVVSTLAFSSILMTYFGVNFYLSGMHSYATGDPVPVPTWVYVLSGLLFVVIVLASRKRDLK